MRRGLQDSRWLVEADYCKANEASEIVIFSCNFFFIWSGYYKYEVGYTPDFRGIAEFAGRLCILKSGRTTWITLGTCRSIGSGATSVTLVPELAKLAKNVTMLQRSPTYVVARPSQDPLANKLRQVSQSSLNQLIRWRQRFGRNLFLSAFPTQAGACEAVNPLRRLQISRAGLRCRDALRAVI